jgi:hypothetical protein
VVRCHLDVSALPVRRPEPTAVSAPEPGA